MNNVTRKARKTQWGKHAKCRTVELFYLKNNGIIRFGCIFEARCQPNKVFRLFWPQKHDSTTLLNNFAPQEGPRRAPGGKK